MLRSTERAPAETVPWTPSAAFAIWVAAVLGSAVWVGVLYGIRGEPASSTAPPVWLFLGQLVLWAAYGCGPFLVAARLGGSDRLGDYFDLELRPADVPLWGSAGVATQLLFVPLIYLPLSRFIDLEEVGEVAEDLIDTAATTSDLVLLFIMVVIMAPLVEEIFFRGFALPALAGRFGTLIGVVGSSVWFAASHFQVVQFPGLLAIGLVLGLVRVRTGRLMPAVLLHLGFNAVTFGVLVSELR